MSEELIEVGMIEHEEPEEDRWEEGARACSTCAAMEDSGTYTPKIQKARKTHDLV